MKFLNLQSISKKLTLMITLAVFPALAILFYSGIEQRQRSIENAKSDVLLLTHAMAETQKEVTQSTRKILSVLSKLPAIQAIDFHESSKIFGAVLEENPEYHNITLVDLSGEVLASGRAFSRANLGDRKHVKEALHRKDFAVGEYIIARVGIKIPVFAFAYPVLDKKGEIKALLTITIKLTTFHGFHDVSALPEKSFVAVTDHRGIRLFYFPAQKKTNPIGKPIKAKNWEIASKAQDPGIFLGTGSDGHRRIFAYEQVHLAPGDSPYLYVWAGIPEAHILAPANAALIRNMLLLLLATVMSLVLSWVIGRNSLILPIKQLVITTLSFAKGDLGARSGLTGKSDELGALAKAFDDMAITLAKSQEELRKREAHLEEAQRIAHIGSWEWDAATDTPVWSKELFKMLEVDPTKPVPPLSEQAKIFTPDSMRKMHAAVEKALKSGSSYEIELEKKLKDGSSKWLLARGESNRNEKGVIISLRGTALDITERKRAEEAEKRFTRLLERSLNEIYIFDAETLLFQEVNWGARENLGYTMEELSTLTPVDLKPEISLELFESMIRPLRSKKQEKIEFFTIHERKDGTQYPVEVHLQLMTNGKPVFVAIILDITERKQAEEEKAKLENQLLQSQKVEAIGTMAGGIAHDFNNVLAAIIGYTEMAKVNLPASNPAQGNLEQVLKASNRAKDLVSHILSFSRMTDHLQDHENINLSSIINEVLKFLRSIIPTTVEIKTDIDENCGQIQGDPTQVHQIIMNLCTNALHAMEKNVGTLEVSLSKTELSAKDLKMEPQLPSGTYIQVSVRDTGIGLTSELIDKIFDPYFTTKEVGKGSGMGLSVVQGIVKNHGGFVKVESQFGEGSTFHIFFPAIEGEIISENTGETEYLPTGTEKILFVDDEEMLVGIGKSMLEMLGYSVTTKTDSNEALDLFKSDPAQFDLVITDQTMPNLPGSELAKRLLQVRPDIPIILCTGYSNMIDEMEALKIGIKEYTMKPVNKNLISRLIRKVLDGDGPAS